MITHEIQPNLRLFELSQITSSVFFFFFSLAALISEDLVKKKIKKLGAASLPQVACFQVSLFEHGTERKVPEVWFWTTPPSQYRLVDTDRKRRDRVPAPH